jgi:pyruvate,water dikinase
MSRPSRDAVRPIDPACELPPEVGGKALGLRLIARAGLHVPPAWAVLPEAGAPEVAALVGALEARGLRSVAVRSSGADEDGAQASFAGVHETALGVPPSRLREAIAAVAASALSDRALAYRRQLGLPPPRGACAVVVQEMVDAEAAGVAFGRGADEVAVEAVEGLGEAAVNGAAQPEALVLLRAAAGWTVARRQARDQPFALRHGPDGPIRLPLEGARRRGAVLSAATAAAIADGVRALEAAAGVPLDVEWAVSAGRVSFLQARPQTRPTTSRFPPGEGWSRANLRETTPELPCALTREFFAPALDRALRLQMAALGHPADPAIPFVAVLHGRLVLNDRTFLDHCDALGLGAPFRAWIRSLAGGAGGTNEIPTVAASTFLRHPVITLRSVIWAGGAEAHARRHLEALRSRRAAAGRSVELDDEDLLARVRANPAFADPDGWIVVQTRLATAVANGHMLAGPILRELDPAALIPRLLEGAEPSVSTRQIDELVALALGLRGWAGSVGFLTSPPAHAAGWRAALPADLSAAVDRWLAAYGHRGPFESDLSSPRYRDDLRLLAAALLPLVAAERPPEGPDARQARRIRDSEEAWAEVTRAVSRLQRARLRRLLRSLARVMALRERFRSEIVTDFAAVRDDVRELGRRLAAAGRVAGVDDVFHLRMEELALAVQDPAFDVQAAVHRELARRAAWRRVEVPNRFTSEEVDGIAARGLGPLAGADTLTGTAVSPGVAEAPACVLRSPEEGARMPSGAVLVAPATDPGWTPLFARASAVVVEIGGLFSHAATVAREYGLPAVSNVDRVTDRLADGDVVRVDGARGTVDVVSRAAAARR